MSDDKKEETSEELSELMDALTGDLQDLRKRNLLKDDLEFSKVLGKYLTGDAHTDSKLAEHAKFALGLMLAALEKNERSEET